MQTPALPSFLKASSPPHVLASENTRMVMGDVIIALVPAGIYGVYLFGAHAAYVILASVISAVLAEAFSQRLLKRKITVSDLSAVVTGLLLAYNLPPTVPLWIPVVGAAIAIVLVKQIFGGIGHNFMNPALAARAILMASWATHMSGSAFVPPISADVVSSATPLAAQAGEYALPFLFQGNVPGCIGETSALLLILGGIYLMIRRVINWRIPAMFVGTAFAAFWIATGRLDGAYDALYQILSGGLLLGAIFMATDYASSPITPIGQLVMGIGCGLLLFVIRRFGSYPEGCSYAILLMNLCVPLIERFTKPRVYGEGKQNA